MIRDNRPPAVGPAQSAPACIMLVVVLVTGSLFVGATVQAQSPPAMSPESSPAPNDRTNNADKEENTTIERLEGEAWQLQEYLTEAGLKPAVSDADNRYVEFSDGRFRLNAGCNTLNGSYWLEGTRLIFSPHVTSLLQDCPDTLMAQERVVLTLLGLVERFDWRTGQMALMDAQGTVLLTLSRPDAVPLQGRLWRLQAYRNNQDTIVMALPNPPFTLWFENAANLTGEACDTYRAVFTRDERSLRLIGPIAVSRRGCTGSPEASRQGADYIEALTKVDSYRVDAKALLLRDIDGRMLASFAAIEDDSQARSQSANRTENSGTSGRRPELMPRPAMR